MLIKPGVEKSNVSDEIWYALGYADGLHMLLFGGPCVVTSLRDGTHNPGSLHPVGKAADLRIRDLSDEQAHKWMAELKKGLDLEGFDVVFEGGVGATPATTGAHVHVEYQPKSGENFIKEAV